MGRAPDSCDLTVCRGMCVCVCVTQVQAQAHGAVQTAGWAAPTRHAVCAPGHRNLKRQVTGGRRLLPHQGVGGVEELGV